MKARIRCWYFWYRNSYTENLVNLPGQVPSFSPFFVSINLILSKVSAWEVYLSRNTSTVYFILQPFHRINVIFCNQTWEKNVWFSNYFFLPERWGRREKREKNEASQSSHPFSWEKFQDFEFVGLQNGPLLGAAAFSCEEKMLNDEKYKFQQILFKFAEIFLLKWIYNRNIWHRELIPEKHLRREKFLFVFICSKSLQLFVQNFRHLPSNICLTCSVRWKILGKNFFLNLEFESNIFLVGS